MKFLWLWFAWNIGFFAFDVYWAMWDIVNRFWPLAIFEIVFAGIMSYMTIKQFDRIMEARREQKFRQWLDNQHNWWNQEKARHDAEASDPYHQEGPPRG